MELIIFPAERSNFGMHFLVILADVVSHIQVQDLPIL